MVVSYRSFSKFVHADLVGVFLAPFLVGVHPYCQHDSCLGVLRQDFADGPIHHARVIDAPGGPEGQLHRIELRLEMKPETARVESPELPMHTRFGEEGVRIQLGVPSSRIGKNVGISGGRDAFPIEKEAHISIDPLHRSAEWLPGHHLGNDSIDRLADVGLRLHHCRLHVLRAGYADPPRLDLPSALGHHQDADRIHRCAGDKIHIELLSIRNGCPFTGNLRRLEVPSVLAKLPDDKTGPRFRSGNFDRHRNRARAVRGHFEHIAFQRRSAGDRAPAPLDAGELFLGRSHCGKGEEAGEKDGGAHGSGGWR